MLGIRKNVIIMAAALTALILLAFGCAGGGTDPADDTNETVDPGYISGTITVTGTDLADLDDTDAVGDLDADKWSAWLIDTIEDVDTISLVNDDQAVAVTTVTDPGTYILAINLLPAVDMSGDGSVATPVTVSVPVTIESTVETSVTVAVEFTRDISSTASQATSRAGDYRVRLQYRVTGPENIDELVELQWLNQTLRSDSDGDGNLDDEPDYFDSNRDFMSDGLQERIEQQGHRPQEAQDTGEIVLINLGMRNLRINNQLFRTDELTRVERLGRRIPLTDLAVGDQVRVTYFRGGGNGGGQQMNFARLIEVLE